MDALRRESKPLKYKSSDDGKMLTFPVGLTSIGIVFRKEVGFLAGVNSEFKYTGCLDESA